MGIWFKKEPTTYPLEESALTNFFSLTTSISNTIIDRGYIDFDFIPKNN